MTLVYFYRFQDLTRSSHTCICVPGSCFNCSLRIGQVSRFYQTSLSSDMWIGRVSGIDTEKHLVVDEVCVCVCDLILLLFKLSSEENCFQSTEPSNLSAALRFDVKFPFHHSRV